MVYWGISRMDLMSFRLGSFSQESMPKKLLLAALIKGAWDMAETLAMFCKSAMSCVPGVNS